MLPLITSSVLALSLWVAGPRLALAQDSNSSPKENSSQEDSSFWDRLRDDEDGKLDLSKLVLSGQGFLPLVIPITEPAVGFGAAGGLVYFHPPGKPVADEEERPPPSMSFGGGGLTTNGTWAAAAGHSGVWRQGALRYFGVAFYADVNLTLYGTAGLNQGGDGIGWNAKVGGTLQELKGSIGSHLFLGGQYLFTRVKNSLDGPASTIDPGELASNLAGAGISLSWDNRDNSFTPNRGFFAKALGKYHSPIVGSDFEYSQLDLSGFGYWELGPFVLGTRLLGSFLAEGVPFYGLSFLNVRGVPAFRYLGRHVLQAEIEPRWRIDGRWSLVGFAAAGQAVGDLSQFGAVDTIIAGGGGFRYLLARTLGLGAGLDVGVGPEETAVYIIIGSYWPGL